MKKVSAKPVSASRLETTYFVLPEHTNPLGNIFGGTVMSWIDVTAAVVAFRHCRSLVVTAAMDELHFLHPIKLGDLVTLKAAVNYTSPHSVEVGVKVMAENPISGETKHTSSAYLTFVSLNKRGKAQTVTQVTPVTEEEKRRFTEGKKRRALRLERRKYFKQKG